MIKVAKFGGTSLASGESFEKVKNIVTNDPSKRIIVVSAPGKRFDGDTKVTDLLYILQAYIKFNAPYGEILTSVRKRFEDIKEYCGLSTDVGAEFDLISARLNKKTSVDYIVSRGEYLCGKLMADYLGFKFIDSADCIAFDYSGKVDYEKSYKLIEEKVKEVGKAVISGFYGSLPNGEIKTFSRGGSDVTGAIVAAAINADAYENWTDVSGIMAANPRIVSDPSVIENVTFAELRELSYMGAQVLHEETVFPVRSKNIPVYIKNTNDPAARGTLVMESFPDEESEKKEHSVTGISGKKHFTVITLTKSRMNEDVSFMKNALAVFESYGIEIELVSSGIDSFTVTAAESALGDNLYNIITRLKETVSPNTIKTEEGISLIAVVGRKLAYNIGVAGKIFSSLGENGINIKMLEQGTDELSIIIGVEDKDYEKAIKVLYKLI